MKIEFEIKSEELEWEDNACLRLIQTSPALITVEANKEGLISFAKQLLTIAYADDDIFVHLQAEKFTESGYWYGDLDEGSLEICINKVNKNGRKRD